MFFLRTNLSEQTLSSFKSFLHSQKFYPGLLEEAIGRNAISFAKFSAKFKTKNWPETSELKIYISTLFLVFLFLVSIAALLFVLSSLIFLVEEV